MRIPAFVRRQFAKSGIGDPVVVDGRDEPFDYYRYRPGAAAER